MNANTLKARIPRTWGAFFGRHGNFTPIQLESMPLLLDGHNVLLHAGTASGKTEAALAPLIERHLPPDRIVPRLTLLYLMPTRALINDMSVRLAAPLNMLRIRAAIRTHDDNTFAPRHPADLLLTTPESLDSLLTSEAKILIDVRAVMIDELHAFDSSVRGDQLRILLHRLRALRTFATAKGDSEDENIQFAALSATLTQPETSATHYFPNARIVHASGQRAIHAERIALDEENPAALIDYLQQFRQRGWKKALAFCNTRAEVEWFAAAVRRAHSPFGDNVYVHYSNLDQERRHAIEHQFAHAEAAICFASATLELGIDIGTVDIVLMIGAPGSAESFVQRVGRASRRDKVARAACFYRTPLERILFEALITLQQGYTASTPFRPSVAIQQIFSLLKGSPTGGIRFHPTLALFNGLLSAADLDAILGELQASGYLRIGRPGEWRAGERLNRLIDMQASEHTPISLYSNLQNSTNTLKIRDQLTHRVIARVDPFMVDSHTVRLEGRTFNIEWLDGNALWVSPASDEQETARFYYRAARPLLAYEVARQIPKVTGLAEGDAPYIPIKTGWVYFHWLGDIYGRALVDLLRDSVRAESGHSPALCLWMADEPRAIPTWTMNHVVRYLFEHVRTYERIFPLGAYHTLLPLEIRRRVVVEQFDVPRFIHAVNALRTVRAPEMLTESLQALMSVDKHLPG